MRGWVIGAALLVGCGGDPHGGSPDAGPDGSGEDGGEPVEPAPPEAPAPPASPAAPRMTPCPEGWRAVEDPDAPELVTCNPWPEGGRQDCAADEAHFPGSAACERIGTACPAGDYAEDIPVGAVVVHVRAGAVPGGDGSVETPFATIGAAIAAAPDEAVIALSKGTFDEVVTLDRPVALWGACVAETIVAPSLASEEDAAVTITADGAVIVNLQVGGARLGVDVVAADAVRIESVLVDGTTVTGVRVTAAGVLAAANLVVRDTSARASDDAQGYGLDVVGGGRADVARGVFERNTTVGVIVDGIGTVVFCADVVVADTSARPSDATAGIGIVVREGGSLELTRAVLREHRLDGALIGGAGSLLDATDLVVSDNLWQESDERGGGAIDVGTGARAVLTRVTLERNRTSGIHVYDTSTQVEATDLVVRDTLSRQADTATGTAIVVDDEAHMVLTRAAFLRNRENAIDVRDPGTELVATDVTVQDTRPSEASGDAGAGLLVMGGARVELERGRFTRSRAAGMIAFAPDTVLVATDVVVEETGAQESDGLLGFGLWVADGASVELLRAAFEGNRAAGIYAHDEGAVLVAQDVGIRDTLERESDDGFGVALYVGAGASVDLQRGSFERNRYAGIQVSGATLAAEDLVVRDTASRVRDGVAGYGLLATAGGVATCTRASFETNRAAGVLALFGVGAFGHAEVTLEDTVVTGTQEQACAPDGCPALGYGIVADNGAIVATRFRISDNALCGAQLTATGTIDLHEGEVSRNPIGANVQSDTFDVSRLEDHVLYLDNGRSLDSTELPVPGVDDFEL